MVDGPVRSVKLAVLGSPIAHSKSPALHRAAYETLGLDWQYELAEVTSEGLEQFVLTRDSSWRGLSLTMPLKQTVLPLLDTVDDIATRTGAANTLLFDRDLLDRDGAAGRDAAGDSDPDTDPDARGGDDQAPILRGFNTDVAGIVRALNADGLDRARFVHILGGGATAASAIAAAADLGAERVLVSVRSVERSLWLEPLAHSLGLAIQFRSLAIADRTVDVPDLVVSTLPGGADADVLFTDSTRRRARLLDVAYDPWPSALAVAWEEVGGRVVSGLAMLVHQALLQVRIFVAGDPFARLPREAEVLEAMLDAVGLDRAGRPAMPES
jgi:shikimate dehydrogenase